MKRFYKIVTHHETSEGFRIHLDGKPVKTPQKNILSTSHEGLAEAIVLEWASQGDAILPDTMPLTQILTTKIDRVSAQRAEMTGFLLKYINTDLIFYRAETPPEMPQRQAEAWDPILKWMEQRFDCQLKTTTTIQAIEQPQKLHEAISKNIISLDDDHFTILQLVSSLTGSIAIGMMFLEKKINAENAFNAARVEEKYHGEIYGEEKYGPEPQQEKKDRAIQRDLTAAANYLDLIEA